MNFRSQSIYQQNFKYHWLGTDSHQRYLDNLKYDYEKLQSNNWLNCQIEYKTNSHGFRCDDFNNDDSIMFLGCSHTLGIGLPLECTWGHIVSKSLNLKCVNLGLGGSSCDTAYRLASHYIEKLKPKIVVLRPPESSRFEIFNTLSQPVFHFVHQQESVNKYRDWFSCDYNHVLNQEKNIIAIEVICNRNNTKFIVANEIPVSETDDVARDLLHFGVIHNKRFANNVLALINGAP